MTIREFSDQFDILFDSISSKEAPNFDEYEKSVYLTKAQLEIVKNRYSPLGNKYQQGFEASEKRRVDLKELIKDYKVSSFPVNTRNISNKSKFVILPNDLFLIIYESIILTSEDSCINNKEIRVKPKTYDEYNIQKDNPFKKPNEKIAWRLDFSKQNNNKNVEIISYYDFSQYKMRYIKYPNPIILTNLANSFPGENLTIEGLLQPQTSELSEEIHQEILDRAVLLAMSDYKKDNINSRVLMNSKNE